MSTMWESGSGLQVAAEVRQDLSVLQIGCKFKQTNEQTNKQTNKQTNMWIWIASGSGSETRSLGSNSHPPPVGRSFVKSKQTNKQTNLPYADQLEKSRQANK